MKHRVSKSVAEQLGIKKRHKYGAKATEVDGIVFPSKKEAGRYGELKFRERRGEIKDLELQPRFDIIVNGVKCGFYKADARYVVVKSGESIVEDTKGFLTPVYKLKKKLVEALYGIKITEV